jgi:hypothetical protein
MGQRHIGLTDPPALLPGNDHLFPFSLLKNGGGAQLRLGGDGAYST